MSSIYGNLVTLSNLRLEGARPDGSVDPGADLICIVDFDSSGAGCESDGYCTPGADISWYINGDYAGDTVASGYDRGLGGYSVASPGFTAPGSGTITVTAKSQNQVALTFAVVATGSEPGAGSVRVTGVTCGTGPDYQCSCESNGQLVVYFSRQVVFAGSGTAYVDVLIDGVTVLSNSPTSAQQGMDSVALTCPQDGNNHTITVKGKNDAGVSVVLYAGTPLGGRFSVASGLSSSNLGSTSYESEVVVSENLGLITSGIGLQGVSSETISLPLSLPKVITDDTLLWLAGGAAVVIGGIVLAKYLSEQEHSVGETAGE